MTDGPSKYSPSPLATFDNRYSLRHVRTYPHPIERVWQAISTAEHLDQWMLPYCKVDRRLGGRWAFTFGGPADGEAIEGVIVAFEPPRLIDYGGMRFELEEVPGGTRLTFIHSFAPDFRHPSQAVDNGSPGSDLPAGPGTPWQPGFVSGFHGMLDDIDAYLRGEDLHRTLEQTDPRYLDLIALYRPYIRDHIPAN